MDNSEAPNQSVEIGLPLHKVLHVLHTGISSSFVNHAENNLFQDALQDLKKIADNLHEDDWMYE